MLLAGRNSTHVRTAPASNQWFQQVNDRLLWKNTVVARTETAGSLETTYPWLPCATYTPAQWPDYQPCTLSGDIDDFEVDQIIGKTKVSEYMKYLANVRSLPIGLTGNIAGGTYCANTAQLGAATSSVVNAPNCNFTEYRVSMPFLSGIYGILADKMFPDLLIGANNIRIEFKLASNNKAFWLTMDPCRRVPGTVRDFTPFGGGANGSLRLNQSCSPAYGNLPVPTTYDTGTGLFTYNPAGASLGCGNAMVTAFNSTNPASNAYISNITNVGVVAGTSSQIVVGSNMYNSSSAMGEDLIASQAPCYPSDGPAVAGATGTASVGATGIFTVTVITANVLQAGVVVILGGVYYEITSQLTGTDGGVGTYSVVGAPDAPVASEGFTVQATTSCQVPIANGQQVGFHLGSFSNLPKPQYVPSPTPWSQKSLSSIASYCNERASCYGTYLPASVPQTRRCQVSSRLAISDAIFAQAGVTAFAIRDLQVRGLPLQPPLLLHKILTFLYSTLVNKFNWTIFPLRPLFSMRPRLKLSCGLAGTVLLKPIVKILLNRILFFQSKLVRQLHCIWFSARPFSFLLPTTTRIPFPAHSRAFRSPVQPMG